MICKKPGCRTATNHGFDTCYPHRTWDPFLDEIEAEPGRASQREPVGSLSAHNRGMDLHPDHDRYLEARMGPDACACSLCGQENTAIVHGRCFDCLSAGWTRAGVHP